MHLLFENIFQQIVIREILYCFILVIGLIGNSLSFMLMMHKNVRSTPFGFYLANVAVADTGYLLFGIIPILVRAYNGFDILIYSEVLCQGMAFLQFVSGDYAIWLLMALSVDRFIAVKYPFKVKLWCTMKKTQLVCIGLFCLSCLFNSYVFVIRNIFVENGNLRCTYSPEHDKFNNKIRPWYLLAGLVIIPGISLCTFNAIIIVIMWRQIKARRNMGATEDHVAENKAIQTTITLLAINIMFITLVCPCFSILSAVIYMKLSVLDLQYVVTVCVFLIHINHAINIFLYGLTSSQFRCILKGWLCFFISNTS